MSEQAEQTTTETASDETSVVTEQDKSLLGSQEQNEGAQSAEPENAASENPTEETTQGEVPETYGDFSLPEGVVLPEERLSRLHEFAKTNGWSQEQAQAGIDLYMKLKQEDAQVELDAVVAQRKEWVDSIQTDRIIGGDKLEQSLSVASRGLDVVQQALTTKFGEQAADIRQIMDSTGMGDHPAFVQAFYVIGGMISDDQMVTAGSAGSEQRSREEILYSS